jgi:polysaccharide biosynthesis/export protein
MISRELNMYWQASTCHLRVAALSLLLLAGGCASRGGSIPYDVENFGAPDPASATVGLTEDVRILPLDTLRINVFQVPDLSGDRQVDLAGNITMPLIGSVRAVDSTPSELRSLLTQRLGEKYLRNPDVSVSITASARRNITIDGSVRYPGVYPVNGPLTLLQAVANARGPDEAANPRRVAIFRQVDGKRMAAAFDLVSIRRGEAEDPVVYSGDIIIVDGNNLRAIQREVFQALPILSIWQVIQNSL